MLSNFINLRLTFCVNHSIINVETQKQCTKMIHTKKTKITKTALGFRVGESALYITEVNSIKEAREVLECSLAHQWLAANYLPKNAPTRTAELPSMETMDFKRKAFYISVRNLVLKLYMNGEFSINQACDYGNRIIKSRLITFIDFADIALINNRIKSDLLEIIQLQNYR